MSDLHTKTQFAWQRQIVADHKLPRSALHVALVIADHINRQSGEAWPGQDRIAEACGLSRSGVRKAIDALVERRHLEVSSGRGRNVTSRYRWLLKPETGGENVHSGDSFETDAEVENGHSNAKKGHSSDPEKGYPSDQEPSETNTLREPSEGYTPSFPQDDHFGEDRRETDGPPNAAGSAEADPPPDDPGDEDGFEAFWRQYPRRVAKAAARKAWHRASRKVEPGEIIRGAMRYAAEREGQDPRYTKHPATWLRAECWADAPAPKVVPFARQGTGQRPVYQTGLDIAAQLIERREAETRQGGWA